MKVLKVAFLRKQTFEIKTMEKFTKQKKSEVAIDKRLGVSLAAADIQTNSLRWWKATELQERHNTQSSTYRLITYY